MAIWEKLFSKITFKDYPDTSTPLNASNMNALSDAIDGIDDRVVELNSKLAKKVNVNHPNITGALWNKDITTGNTQLINAGGDTMIVGNPSIKLYLESSGTNKAVDDMVIKSDLEWKLLGVYNAQSGVNVSDINAREFFVIHSKDTLCIEHHFPANMGNAEMYGGFYNSASSFIGESLTYVDGVIYGRVFVASGTDHSASAVIQVYYR